MATSENTSEASNRAITFLKGRFAVWHHYSDRPLLDDQTNCQITAGSLLVITESLILALLMVHGQIFSTPQLALYISNR